MGERIDDEVALRRIMLKIGSRDILRDRREVPSQNCRLAFFVAVGDEIVHRHMQKYSTGDERLDLCILDML